MTSTDLLLDGFGRISGVVHDVLDDVTPAELTFRVDPHANTIAWLTWHLSRVLDQAVAGSTGAPQAWDDWRERFNLPFSDRSTGYGHSSEQVAAVTTPARDLLGYFDAVHARTLEAIAGLTDAELASVVDTNWDPPVTLAVRLVSILSDALQHAGQAAFILGVARRLN